MDSRGSSIVGKFWFFEQEQKIFCQNLDLIFTDDENFGESRIQNFGSEFFFQNKNLQSLAIFFWFNFNFRTVGAGSKLTPVLNFVLQLNKKLRNLRFVN